MAETMKYPIFGGPDRFALSEALFSTEFEAAFVVLDSDGDGSKVINVAVIGVIAMDKKKNEWKITGTTSEGSCSIMYTVAEPSGWVVITEEEIE